MGTAFIAESSPAILSYDTGTYAVLHAVGTTTDVVSLALSPDESTLYSIEVAGQVSSFTASTLGLIHTVSLPAGNFQNIITSADGALLYTADQTGNLVYVLDAGTLATVTSFGVLNGPYGLAVTPTDSALYVTRRSVGMLAVYGIPGYGLVTNVAVGTQAANLSMSIDGLTLYGTNLTVPSVFVVSTSTNTLSTTIALSGAAQTLDLRITPNDRYVYAVTNASQAAIAWQITTASNTVTDTLTLGSPSQHLAVTTDSLSLWIPEVQGSPNLTEIWNIPADTLQHSMAFGAGITPGAIVITPTSGFKPPPPPSPPYPGSQFIPKLFIPQKGKQDRPYTPEELRANWMAIEVWSQRWIPPSPVALSLPRKYTPDAESVNANWITLEVWTQKINALGAPYSPLFIPRKPSLAPRDLDIDFLRVQNWANRLPL